MPAPVTTPVPETVATPVLLLLQTPPPVASVRLVVLPRQTVATAGVIAAAPGFTVTVAVEKHAPII